MLTSTISFTGADPGGGAPGAHPPGNQVWSHKAEADPGFQVKGRT
jgi:hypothetical protein